MRKNDVDDIKDAMDAISEGGENIPFDRVIHEAFETIWPAAMQAGLTEEEMIAAIVEQINKPTVGLLFDGDHEGAAIVVQGRSIKPSKDGTQAVFTPWLKRFMVPFSAMGVEDCDELLITIERGKNT